MAFHLTEFIRGFFRAHPPLVMGQPMAGVMATPVAEQRIMTVVRDKRRYLKVKLKALAEESRIIRKEEAKLKGKSHLNEIREGMYLHRVKDVRTEARATLIAYGFIRGKKYSQIERPRDQHTIVYAQMWGKVTSMVARYGAPSDSAIEDSLKAWRECTQ